MSKIRQKLVVDFKRSGRTNSFLPVHLSSASAFALAFIMSFSPLLSTSIFAQTKPAKIWASVQFNKRTVMVGEPLVVTVSVFTSTWFTNPPEFSEIQVPNALMARLEQRGGARTVTIGRKKYPAIEQKFVVYPVKVGENSMPSITIETESPPEGDYKGRRRIIRSPERKFTVLAPPEGVLTEQWLTAYNIQLNDTWDRPLDNLKAGDVLERRITILASGALAALIPPLDLGEIDFGTIYLKSPQLSNVQNQASFSGRRIEIASYLLEKSGTFQLPEITFSWFNPTAKSIQSKSLPAIELVIAENPNLEFILSMQDSLQSLLAAQEAKFPKEPFTLLGLNWWQLIIAVVTSIIIFYLLFKGIHRVLQFYKRKKKVEAESEGHYFEELLEKWEKKTPDLIYTQIWQWYDQVRDITELPPSITDFIKSTGNKNLLNAYVALEYEIFAPGSSQNSFSKSQLKHELEHFRKLILKEKQIQDSFMLPDLNPAIS